MNYKEKYIKYKTKYLKLKFKIGGYKIYSELYEKIKNQDLWSDDKYKDEHILADKNKYILNELWNHQQYNDDSSIPVNHAYNILVKKYNITEEEFFLRLSKTRIQDSFPELKNLFKSENPEDKVIKDEILERLIHKLPTLGHEKLRTGLKLNSNLEKPSNNEVYTEMTLQINIKKPFTIKKVKTFLESKGYNVSNFMDEFNCLTKNHNNCIESIDTCRWEPNNNTCYRVDYSQRSRNSPQMNKIEIRLDTIDEE
tara:strand:+ start:147 stop:908 length:762 start_codon:yes stop_codon:yes gene_type:complete